MRPRWGRMHSRFSASFELLSEFQGGAIEFAAHDGIEELDFALKSRDGPLTNQLTPAAGGGGGGQIRLAWPRIVTRSDRNPNAHGLGCRHGPANLPRKTVR